jgi:UrcA family protein
MRVGTFLTLATFGCLAVSGLSMAQQMSEVVVEAPHVESTKVKGTPALSIVYHVSFADLDLATNSGAVELQKRVKDSATQACDQIKKLYPNSIDTEPTCVETAIKNGMAQANKAIAAAEKK